MKKEIEKIENSQKEPRNWWALSMSVACFFGGQLFLWLLEAPIWLQVSYCAGFLGIMAGASARHHSFVFVFRFYVPVVTSLALLYLYFWGYQQDWFVAFFATSRLGIEYLELLFDVLSTLYAICTAFLLWKGLTDHDNLRHVLRDEANQMQRVLNFLHYFEEQEQMSADDLEAAARNVETVNQIRFRFFKYVCNIFKGDRIQTHSENLPLLQEVIDLIKDIKVLDDNDRVALAEVMKGVSDLIMVRSKRVSQMEISMSPYLLSALMIMSLTILYPFFTEGPTGQGGTFGYVNAICIVVLGGLLSFLQMTLFDIGRPFDGYWKIRVDSFDDLKRNLKADLMKSTGEEVDCEPS